MKTVILSILTILSLNALIQGKLRSTSQIAVDPDVSPVLSGEAPVMPCLSDLTIRISNSTDWSKLDSISIDNSSIYMTDSQLYAINSTLTGNGNSMEGTNNTSVNDTIVPTWPDASATDTANTENSTITISADGGIVISNTVGNQQNQTICIKNSVIYIDDSTLWAIQGKISITNTHIFANGNTFQGIEDFYKTENTTGNATIPATS